jgi:AraC-like DNA-binding protein
VLNFSIIIPEEFGIFESLNKVLQVELLFDQIEINLRQASLLLIIFQILWILALFAFSATKKTKPHRILTANLLTFFSIFGVSTLMAFNLTSIFLPLLFMYFPLIFFIAPLSYSYICSLTNEKYKFSKQARYHFILPAAFWLFNFILNILIVTAQDPAQAEKLQTIFVDINFGAFNFVFGIQFLLYLYLIIRRYRTYRLVIPQIFSYREKVSLRWIKAFIIAYTIFMLQFNLSNNPYLFISGISEFYYDLIFFSSVLFYISLIGIFGSREINYLDKDKSLNSQTEIQKEEKALNLGKTKNQSLQGFYNDEQKKNELFQNIIDLIEKEKLYVNPELSLNQLSDQLKINRKYISYVINEITGSSFFTLINKYRVIEAKKHLLESEYDQYSIEGIAQLSGFKSKSSFYRSFKDLEGITPAQFKKQQKQA